MPTDLHALRIMTIEDQPAQQARMRDLLAQLGIHAVHEARNGQAALRAMVAMTQAPDVVITDLDMPGMDGVEFIRHLGHRPLACALILASGMEPALIGSVEAMARVQGLQVLGTLQKPIDPAALQTALARYVPCPRTDPARSPEMLSEEALRAAIDGGEIVPYFQPKICIHDGRMVGAEALARWQHAEYGTIEPERFIPLAERRGLIEPLTWLMLESAMQRLAAWQRAGHTWSIAVNLSLSHLERTHVADRIAELADRHEVPHERLVLEVTERFAAVNLAPILANLARLRMKGFGVAIDDYGTGYSSLEQLSRIPFTELKIDRSFVAGASSRAMLRTILGSSIELARQLKLDSVAEGVESESDLTLLRELGCNLAQGDYISPALPAAEFDHWLVAQAH